MADSRRLSSLAAFNEFFNESPGSTTDRHRRSGKRDERRVQVDLLMVIISQSSFSIHITKYSGAENNENNRYKGTESRRRN